MFQRALELAPFTVLLAALLPAGAALANDTSLNVNVDPPRLLSAEALPVRMQSEHITIHFGREQSSVTVEFVFENLEDNEVSAWVGFPDEDLLNRYLSFISPASVPGGDVWSYYNMYEDELAGTAPGPDGSRIQNFQAWTRPADAPAASATDLPYSIMRIERLAASVPSLDGFPNGTWEPQADVNNLLVCRAFQLTWAPKQSLVVGHSYKTSNGGNTLGQTLFQYTLATGGNWRGTIGRADIDIYLDGWKASDLHFKSKQPQEYEIPFTIPGEGELEKVSDTHLKATWRDFEPRSERGWVYLATQPTYPGNSE